MKHHYSTLSDIELIALLKKGDPKAITATHNHYWPQLMVHAKHFLRDDDLARSVVQDLLSSFFANISHLEIKKSLKAYLTVAVRNSAYNLIRKRKISKIDYVASIADLEITDGYETDQQLLLKELMDEIDQVIQRMPEQMKEVYQLSFREGMTNLEIAAQLNLSPSTVSTQLARATKKLRENPHIASRIMLVMLLSFSICAAPTKEKRPQQKYISS